jgi:endonuclease/exonuclease/phosphatase family metal-dependent hydrolase
MNRVILSILLLVVSSKLFSQEDITIMSYNILNYPGSTSAQRNPHFQKVISQAMPDILVLQEMISQEGVDEFKTQVMDNIPNNYEAGTFINGTDSDNAIFYNASLFNFISNTPIKTELRDINEFKLYHPHGGDTLRIYSVHLKSSSSTANQNFRATEIDSLRKVTDNLSSGAYFIVLGDFNFYKSSEPAYIKLLDQTNSGYFHDPLSMNGTWNNASYAAYHTQSTRTAAFGGGTTGGLDDRFDLILFSNSVWQSGGITYLSNSYNTLGNDANHYNLEINTSPNNAVSSDVAEALYQASDHLPITAVLTFENAMPVELTAFTAEQTDAGIMLKWETATEINNYGFEIERSNLQGSNKIDDDNNLEGYRAIGFVQGHGNSNSPKSYEYLDHDYDQDQELILKYRLKQIDTDGTFEYYSTIASIDLSLPTNINDNVTLSTFNLEQNYPNPFNPATTIQYSIPLPTLNLPGLHTGGVEVQHVTIKVYDILGNEVAALVNESQKPGSYSIEWDASAYSSGFYIYQLTYGTKQITKKMLMLK